MSLPASAGRIFEFLARPGSYELTEAFFIRLLGLIYLTAFASLLPQVVALLGSRGVVPAVRVLHVFEAEYGGRPFSVVPSLFWFYPTDGALLGFCIAGCVAALLAVIGVAARGSALACFILYLSLVTIGEPFMNFQWDALLLECGFLALFAGAPWLVWGYRFLLFRLIFESGVIKLASHDPNWRNLHALRYHFMTQPLPDPVAYYAYRAPGWFLDFSTAATLAIEIAAPFLLFGPRRVRQAGAWILISFQILIVVTGNYAFFNLLTIALCVWAFDDRTFQPLTPLLRWSIPRVRWPRVEAWRVAGNVCITILMVIGALQVCEVLVPAAARPLLACVRFLQPFEVVNPYGLFAVMTTTRPEIIIEGSDDNQNWREYSFPFKPGNTHRGLPWVAPYQPRLDWQMWFAALGPYESNVWVAGLMFRLLTGERSVEGLLDPLPFSKPPRYMRAVLYSYDFTTPEERARTGAVWRRELRRIWFGPVSLSGK